MPAIIPLIIAGVTAGIGATGGGGSSSSTDATALAKSDAEKQAQQEALTKANLLRRASPDAQAQVGGSLTEAPFASLTSDIAGLPGDIQTALRLLDPNSSGTQGLAFAGGA